MRGAEQALAATQAQWPQILALTGREMPEKFEVLARYNAERARGMSHTPEMDEAMRKLQAEFDEWQGGHIEVNAPAFRPDLAWLRDVLLVLTSLALGILIGAWWL
ncbi:hypothetical protein G1H11_21820 [Phytoactinopolyspora alkaliphila]|uniref:Uncharacterized protein n=1 Tax=Phytoactinopolyspora alkaliphila TaxID=1783498 RepID=A0A6N9YSD3_9ACTN|nr:hypothetical protein [Phytoactinopolyspora alkaliphila]NED97941.1 hypothetical protein [Phytoactinopolyspora alkaliphila]